MSDKRLDLHFPEKFSGSRENIDYENSLRWRLKIITAGDTRIIKLYPVRADYTQPRIFRGSNTREAQRKLNKKNAMERFRLLFMNNFTTDNLFVTLTFAKDPSDKNKAYEKFKYFIKKLKKSTDGDIKYLGVIETSTSDEKQTRIHIHAAFSGVDYDAIIKNWIYGFSDVDNIKSVTGAAQYIQKTITMMPEKEHTYIRSRNLAEPVTDLKTLDDRYLPDADELESIIKNPKLYTDVNYPEYEMICEPEIWCSSYMPGYYVKIELVRSAKEAATRNKMNGYHTHQANEVLGESKHSGKDKVYFKRPSPSYTFAWKG